MSESPEPLPYTRQRPPAGQSAFWTLVSAALFLYIGFGMGLVGIGGDPLYDGSVTALVWMGRIVGVGLVIVALLAFAGLRAVLPLNLVMSALATAGCAGIGVVWLAYNDMQGVLLLIFAAVNASAAYGAWRDWRDVASR